MKKKKGFTLIELLVVIAILAVILLIAVPIIVSNIDESKVKSYDNQVSLFVEGSRRYALEYNNDLVWEDTELEGIKKAEVTLRELAEKDYVDLPVTNPKTGEPFDPDKTKVTIYKDKDGNLEFEYEDGDGFSLVIGSKTQTILQTTVYNKQMIMNDVYGKDASNNDITSKVTYTCRFGTEDVDCNTLSSTTKNIGTYYITYRLESGNKTKTATRRVDVVNKSRPIIEVRPENTGTKVDSVRVTIIYPEGAISKIYSTKEQKNKSYTVGFDVYENQTITADCIDKNGLQCETATKVIDYIKPTIEVNDPNKGIVIAASWPNTTSMTLDLSGVSIVKGDGSLEYKCRVGTKETAWSTSSTCNITGLQQGTAYTVKVYARNKKNTADVVEKTTTIYTSKEVLVAAKTEAGTCPTNTNTKVAATDIYEEKEVSGSCNQTMGSTKVSSTIQNSTSCGGGVNLSYTYSGKVYSSPATSTCNVTSSSCISSLSYYACSKSSYSAAGCSSTSYYACSRSSWSASGSTSTSYYACSRSSWSASGCSSLSKYGCSVSSNVASGCSKQVSSGCSVLINSASGCSRYVSSGCSVLINSASGCSNTTTTNVRNPAYDTYLTCVNSIKNTSYYKYLMGGLACENVGSGGNYSSCQSSATAAANRAITQACGTAPAATISSSSTSYYACSRSSYSSNGCTSTSYYACSRSSYSSNGCASTSYYTCSKLVYSSQGCSKYVSSGCSVLINSSKGCSTTMYVGSNVLIYSSSGCSKQVSSGCSVLINSSSGCSKSVCSRNVSYYTTKYEATIKYPTTYTITYTKVIVKPKQTIY